MRAATAGTGKVHKPSFLRWILLVTAFFAFVPSGAGSQSNPAFNINLSIDYEAAEQTLKLLRDEYVSTRQLADLRGKQDRGLHN